MQIPLQIIFRGIPPSEAVEARIREKATKLERFNEHIMSCRVAVESEHHHHHQGNLYHVRIDITTPGKEIVISREHHDNQAHEDAYVAIRDAFNAATRQLEDYVRIQRGEVKSRAVPED
ncbi:HPF/RaiA family ribosome-associated protein [Methylomicrobium sp. Wu6]|uniref:HPF/RaiA family ribosome-associated protein n=1 Tax=Methylomicrobium sp. Wu6 TaxID=3107928 RepID=UPI002DD67FF1|nr:HPF/RaiA family ribosome-associated protein [Methylomicrobium sp. Wu6]MEC4749795.1 HPF/RaiA family ribosome-associated protein [Methylomicrobium sp. Wu6]